jgi:hypothetical protein
MTARQLALDDEIIEYLEECTILLRCGMRELAHSGGTGLVQIGPEQCSDGARAGAWLSLTPVDRLSRRLSYTATPRTTSDKISALAVCRRALFPPFG